MDPMTQWLQLVASELGVEMPTDSGDLLDVTRAVAHNVSRPAAPLTLFLIGEAVRGGADPAQVNAQIAALVAHWQQNAT